MNGVMISIGVMAVIYLARKLLSYEGNVKFSIDMLIYLSASCFLTLLSFFFVNIMKAKMELGVS